MNEMMQTDECLASQAQSCCEGGRRPFSERKVNRPHYYPNGPGPECIIPVDFREIMPQFSQEQVDRIAAIADGTDALLAERGNVYGPPDVNLPSTAQMWEAYDRNREPGRPEGFLDVCYKNILQKISRLARTPTHQDSQDDVIGYMEMAIKYVNENYSGRGTDSNA